MTTPTTPAVVVDTGVFAATLGADPGDLAPRYRSHLEGRAILISFQTAAEIRYGALKGRWGDSRTRQMENRLDQATLVPPHDALVMEAAQLRYQCHKSGHALHHQRHAADLWIAATARLAGMPLVTHDAFFDRTPDLVVIRES